MLSNNLKLVLLLLAICLFLVSSTANSVELNGRISSDLYIYQQFDSTHIRPYETIRANLTVWKKDLRKLSFNTHLRWTTDLSNKQINDPQLFVYNGYMKYSGFVKGASISIGRQFAYTAVGSSLLDGFRLKYYNRSSFSLDLFGGSSVDYFDPEKIQSLDENSMAGVRLSAKPTDKSNIGINWLRKEYESDLYYHRFGIDGGISFDKIRIYTQAAYNVDSHRLAKILYRTIYSYKEWYLSGEFSYREPSVASRSIFSLIDFKNYKQIRLETNRKIKPAVTLISSLDVNFYDDENNYRTSLGILYKRLSLSWIHHSGYGSSSNGISANGSTQYQDWILIGNVNLNRYRIQDEQNDLSDAYSTVLSVRRNFKNNWQIGADWILLKNAVQNNDSRFNIRISKGFSIK